MEIKKTALYEIHKQLGAKIVDFSGYFMPIQYKGIVAEHNRVRETVGMFDVSHMGQFEITGKNAEKYLQYMTINDVSKLNDHQVQYSAMCYEDGGIVDDLLVYRYPDKFLMVVNCTNIEKDFNWMKQHLIEDVTLKNRSDDFSLLAIQGRHAIDVLIKLSTVDLASLTYYWFTEGKIAEIQAMIARTGYTGEDGFEIMFDPQHSIEVWNKIMEAGQEFQIEPIGLGARDTLRLEVKYSLYGNDIDNTTNPLEAGLGWITKIDKGDFIGREAILNQKQQGLSRKLIGFQILDKALARNSYEIFANDKKIGYVTSGTFSPYLKKSIGMGYVLKEYSNPGNIIGVKIRNKVIEAEVVKTPFYLRNY